MNHKLVTIAPCSLIILCLIAFFITKQVQVCSKHYSLKPNLLLNCVTKWPFLGIEDLYDSVSWAKAKYSLRWMLLVNTSL